MKLQRVLVTGAGGKVAQQVRPYLASMCEELRLTDRLPLEPLAPNETVRVAELSEPEPWPGLLDGIDAVVHFAGYPREAPWPTLIEANIRVAINLWDHALAAGVQRIVYASSNHAVGYHARDQRIDERAPARPDSRYGVTKVFMESLASLHADKHGLRAMGIRIGHCGPAPRDARMLSHWVHPEDLAQLIALGLTAQYHHEIVYGVSGNRASWYDNGRANALGYRPRHSADSFQDELSARVTDNPVAERYQGGDFAAEGHCGDPERPARAG